MNRKSAGGISGRRSAVEFEDQELERIWYHNQYFLACCLREGKVAPGLFGNWTSGKIGTAWHGDYHMNYNTQQVFWGVFSSNHVEQHLPYVELCENLLPLSESYAREKFGLPGAFFPHSAYPVPSQTIPYPVPPWGYEICETPWTVQSLWWHYLYTLDKDFLRRVYPLLRAATRFLVAYVKQGPGRQVPHHPHRLAGELGLHGGLPPQQGLHHGPGAHRICAGGRGGSVKGAQ